MVIIFLSIISLLIPSAYEPPPDVPSPTFRSRPVLNAIISSDLTSNGPLHPSSLSTKMVRKLPTQVPAAVSRLIDSSLIQTPPPWYNAVLANPPPVLPPRQVTPRSRPGASAKTYPDLPPHYTAGASSAMAHSGATGHHQAKFLRQPKVRPAPIVYPADRVRRQFFADFPFEALRPVSLVEASNIAAEHPVNGKEWTSLAQRGGYPTVEDTVVFTLNLHDNHGLSMSAAYLRATDEFVKLRATHEVATLAAAAEARAYGAVFKRDEFVRLHGIFVALTNLLRPGHLSSRSPFSRRTLPSRLSPSRGRTSTRHGRRHTRPSACRAETSHRVAHTSRSGTCRDLQRLLAPSLPRATLYPRSVPRRTSQSRPPRRTRSTTLSS